VPDISAISLTSSPTGTNTFTSITYEDSYSIFDDINECAEQENDFQKIDWECFQKKCLLCTDDACIVKNFNRAKRVAISKEAESDEKVEGFSENPRKDVSTGLVVPDWVNLPDTTAVTNYTYTMPCDDVEDCSTWFCTSFMNGPIPKPDKIVDP